jgi:PRTRC genetic system protein E
VFVELMPLLSGRTVMITVAREDERTLRVNVIPTTKSGSTENPALATPLSYTGSPDELDAELGKHLASYVECHQMLGSTLASAKAEMDAAGKAAQEEARKKTEERRKKAAEKPSDNSTAPASVSSAPQPAATASLFSGELPAGMRTKILATHSGSRSGISPFRRASA